MTNNTQKSATECREAEYTIRMEDVHAELSAAIMPIAMASMKGLCHPHHKLLPVLTRALNLIVRLEAEEAPHADTMRLVTLVKEYLDALDWHIEDPVDRGYWPCSHDLREAISQHTGGKA